MRHTHDHKRKQFLASNIIPWIESYILIRTI
jgi:hypothetical protein